jgi:hypothetical protein
VRGIAKRVKEAAAVSNPLATIRAAWGDQESADAIPVKPQVDEGDRAVSVCGSPSTLRRDYIRAKSVPSALSTPRTPQPA